MPFKRVNSSCERVKPKDIMWVVTKSDWEICILDLPAGTPPTCKAVLHVLFPEAGEQLEHMYKTIKADVFSKPWRRRLRLRGSLPVVVIMHDAERGKYLGVVFAQNANKKLLGPVHLPCGDYAPLEKDLSIIEAVVDVIVEERAWQAERLGIAVTAGLAIGGLTIAYKDAPVVLARNIRNNLKCRNLLFEAKDNYWDFMAWLKGMPTSDDPQILELTRADFLRDYSSNLVPSSVSGWFALAPLPRRPGFGLGRTVQEGMIKFTSDCESWATELFAARRLLPEDIWSDKFFVDKFSNRGFARFTPRSMTPYTLRSQDLGTIIEIREHFVFRNDFVNTRWSVSDFALDTHNNKPELIRYDALVPIWTPENAKRIQAGTNPRFKSIGDSFETIFKEDDDFRRTFFTLDTAHKYWEGETLRNRWINWDRENGSQNSTWANLHDFVGKYLARR